MKNSVKRRTKKNFLEPSHFQYGNYKCVAVIFLFLSGSTFNSGLLPDAEAHLEFEAWFVAKGGKSMGIEVSNFSSMGKGVLANKDIKRGDDVLFIPKELILCRETVLKLYSKNKKFQYAMKSIERDDVFLSVAILREKSIGTASRWFPYVKALPQNVSLPILFDDATLNELQDKRFVTRIVESRRKAFRLHLKVLPILNLMVSVDSLRDLDSFLWAMAIISSRALSISGDRYLVPFADFFNGMSQEDARVYDNGNSFLKYHQLSSKGMLIKADRNCELGQQLFEDYGDSDNQIYFEHHGFLMPENQFDCATLQLPSLNSTKNKNIFEITQKLKLPMHSIDACVNSNGRWRKKVAGYVFQLLLMDDRHTEICLKSIPLDGMLRNWDASNCFSDYVLETQSIEVQTILNKAALIRLKSYPTTLKEDTRALLFNHSIPKRTRLAVQYRISQKNILNRILNITTVHALPEDKPRGSTLQFSIDAFNKWLQNSSISAKSIYVGIASDDLRLGTFASKHLADGEVYLSVPRKFMLDQESALACSTIGPLLESIVVKYGPSDAFHELLLHLMYEYFCKEKNSFWYPYLALLPSPTEMKSPLFYSEDVMTHLKGTDMFTIIKKHQHSVKQKYYKIRQRVFVQNADIFQPRWSTFQNYQWAYAILDSRSIWWSGKRHLVPLLDMVNCGIGPDPTKIHNTDFDAITQEAFTRAKWNFQEDEQVFENYGQANYIYLMYHGFILENNPQDCLHIVLPYSFNNRWESESELLQKSSSQMKELCVTQNNFHAIAKHFMHQYIRTGKPHARADDVAHLKRLWSIIADQRDRLQLHTQFSTSKTFLDGRIKMIEQYKQQQFTFMNEIMEALHNAITELK